MSDPSNYEMSLFYAILNDFTPNQEYYNCSDNSAIQGTRTQQTILGGYLIISGCLFILLFIPCIIVGFKSELIKTSCYKIMFLSSFFDILQIIVGSLASGFYGIQAANFCDYPRSIFFFGALGCGSWLGGCLSCVTLAVNRCCDLNPNLKLRWIFLEKRVYFILFLIISYASYGFLFTKPPLFRSDYMSWFFDPRISTNPILYINILHTTNNCLVSLFTTTSYTYLCILLRYKSRSSSSNGVSKTQKQVFFQSAIICSFNAIAAYVYVYMQYFESSEIFILIGHIAWQLSNGSVSIVYLTMNRTIQKGVYKMLVPKKFQKSSKIRSTSIGNTAQANSTTDKIL